MAGGGGLFMWPPAHPGWSLSIAQQAPRAWGAVEAV